MRQFNRYLTNSTGSNLNNKYSFLKKKELRYVKVGNAQSNVLVDLENGTISADSVSTNNFTIEITEMDGIEYPVIIH